MGSQIQWREILNALPCLSISLQNLLSTNMFLRFPASSYGISVAEDMAFVDCH